MAQPAPLVFNFLFVVGMAEFEDGFAFTNILSTTSLAGGKIDQPVTSAC
jgi:hypothetical protein